MRNIRSRLSGLKFTKVSPTEWIIEDRVALSLNYYCGFRATNEEQDKEQKTCHPTSVKVAPYLNREALGKLVGRESCDPSPSYVYKTRSIPRRQDGEINVDSVAVAVTKGIEAYDQYVTRCKNRGKREREVLKIRQELHKDIGNLSVISTEFKDRNHGLGYSSKLKIESNGRWDKVQIDVDHISIDPEKALEQPTITVKFQELTLMELAALLPSLHTLLVDIPNAKAKSSKQGGDGSDSPTDEAD